MKDPFEELRRVLNIAAISVVLIFLIFLVVELGTLLYGAPMVMESIDGAEIGRGSSIIMPLNDVLDENGMIRISISGGGGSGVRVGDYYIFTPNIPMDTNRTYTLTYGRGDSMDLHPNSEFHARLMKSDSMDYVIVAFDQGVNRSQAEGLIHFVPLMRYNTTWYGNTLVIDTENPDMGTTYTFYMNGTLNLTDGASEKVDLKATLHYYGSDEGVERVPEMPSTVVYIMLPPGLIAGISVIEGAAFKGYFMFILISIIVSASVALYQDRKRPIQLSRYDIQRGWLTLPSRSLFMEVGMLLMATLFFTITYYLIVGLFNQNPTVPDFGEEQLWFSMYSLARAGVWEEIVTRIPFIGIPLLITHYAVRKKGIPVWRYFLGGGFEMDMPAMIFIVLSSFFFGMAHAFGGWDMFKVIPAMVGGMAMGYLFLKWGLHASILMHFANDYLNIPSELFPSTGMDIVTGLLMIAMLVAGAYFFFLYLLAFLRHLFPSRIPASRAPAMQGRDFLYGPPAGQQPAQAYQNQYPQGYYTPPYGPQGSAGYVPYPQAQYQQSYQPTQSGYIPYTPPAARSAPQQAPVHPQNHGPGPQIPYAPYPFKCIRCGSTVALLKEGGKVVCTQCGMEYLLKK